MVMALTQGALVNKWQRSFKRKIFWFQMLTLSHFLCYSGLPSISPLSLPSVWLCFLNAFRNKGTKELHCLSSPHSKEKRASRLWPHDSPFFSTMVESQGSSDGSTAASQLSPALNVTLSGSVPRTLGA